jgi:hypothetical protein
MTVENWYEMCADSAACPVRRPGGAPMYRIETQGRFDLLHCTKWAIVRAIHGPPGADS